MEWIKKIIEKAEIKDGKIDIDGIMKEINSEFPKNAVPKSEFNSVNEQLKTANTTIKDLEKSNKDNEDLQTKIKGYETEIENLKADSLLKAKEYALKEKLSKIGVTDADYLIYKHGGIDKFNFDDKGTPIGVEEAVEGYKESIPYIFASDGKKTVYRPVKGKENTAVNPFAKETFNLTKQGELFKENPAQAKELAAQAGISI